MFHNTENNLLFIIRVTELQTWSTIGGRQGGPSGGNSSDEARAGPPSGTSGTRHNPAHGHDPPSLPLRALCGPDLPFGESTQRRSGGVSGRGATHAQRHVQVGTGHPTCWWAWSGHQPTPSLTNSNTCIIHISLYTHTHRHGIYFHNIITSPKQWYTYVEQCLSFSFTHQTNSRS